MPPRQPRHTPNPTFPLRKILRECADAGMSFTQTADKLGMTKGQIAGHARRLGVSFHQRTIAHLVTEKREPGVEATPVESKPAVPNPAVAAALGPRSGGSVVRARSKWPTDRKGGPTCCWSGCRAPTMIGKPYCRAHSAPAHGAKA